MGLITKQRGKTYAKNLECATLNAGTAQISGTELANDSVTTNKIADSAITDAKISASVITGAKIAGTTITAGNIMDGEVTFIKLLQTNGTANIGTAETNVAHGLGETPSIVLITSNGTTGDVYQSTAADGTNLKLTAEAAGAVQWVALG